MEISSTPSIPTAPMGMDMTQLAGRVRDGDQQAIDAVAVGFESLFSSLLVKQMRQTLEPGSLFGEDQGDILGGLFDHYLGQHLAQGKCLGIANLMQKHLTPARRPT